MVWVAIVFFVVIGIAMIAMRVEVADVLGLSFGARLPPGCVIVLGVLSLLLALLFYLGYSAGVLP